MSDSVKKWQQMMEDMYGNIDDCSFTYLESDVNNIEVNEPEEVEISNKAQLRKNTPVYSGVVKYFPLALKEIAKASAQGQKQHNPNKPLAWDRSKSGDELDAMMRHLLDHASGELFDDCGTRHIVKCGWRILAFIQKTMENEK
jgi:hypothetical protein